MIYGRNDWPVSLETIEKIDDEGDSYAIKKSDGWSMFISKDECDGFVPQVGDWILTEQPVNNIATVIIEGRVLRHKSPKQIEAEHKVFKDNYRLRRLEAYVSEGEALKERVKNLHPVLQARMARFAAEHGVEFWIDSAPYEMAVLEGAQALLNKTADLFGANWAEENGTDEDRAEVAAKSIKWIEDWWTLNTKEGGYDYAKQMELVPDFGDGHSGNTAGMAYRIALMILKGEGDQL